MRSISLAIVLLASCASSPRRARVTEPETRSEYEQLVNAFIGTDISGLFAALGKPRTQALMPNRSILYEWELASTVRFGYCLARFTADENNIIRTAFLVGDGCGSE